MPDLRPYRRILALIPFGAGDAAIATKALLLARLNRAELDFLHLIEPDAALDGGYAGISGADEAAALEAAAVRRLEFLAAQLGAGEARCHALHGPARQSFRRHQERMSADLIVAGPDHADLPGNHDRLILGTSCVRRGTRLRDRLAHVGARLRAFAA